MLAPQRDLVQAVVLGTNASLPVRQEMSTALAVERPADRVGLPLCLQGPLGLRLIGCQFQNLSSSEEPVLAHIHTTSASGIVVSQLEICPSWDEDEDTWLAAFRQVSAHRPKLGAPELQDIYAFRNAAAVWSFLETHRFLIDILLEAYPHLERFFGVQQRVTLELVQDPETEGRERLFAYISTALPVAQARELLNAFDDEWFLDQLIRSRGLLNFNLEFI